MNALLNLSNIRNVWGAKIIATILVVAFAFGNTPVVFADSTVTAETIVEAPSVEVAESPAPILPSAPEIVYPIPDEAIYAVKKDLVYRLNLTQNDMSLITVVAAKLTTSGGCVWPVPDRDICTMDIWDAYYIKLAIPSGRSANEFEYIVMASNPNNMYLNPLNAMSIIAINDLVKKGSAFATLSVKSSSWQTREDGSLVSIAEVVVYSGDLGWKYVIDYGKQVILSIERLLHVTAEILAKADLIDTFGLNTAELDLWIAKGLVVFGDLENNTDGPLSMLISFKNSDSESIVGHRLVGGKINPLGDFAIPEKLTYKFTSVSDDTGTVVDIVNLRQAEVIYPQIYFINEILPPREVPIRFITASYESPTYSYNGKLSKVEMYDGIPCNSLTCPEPAGKLLKRIEFDRVEPYCSGGMCTMVMPDLRARIYYSIVKEGEISYREVRYNMGIYGREIPIGKIAEVLEYQKAPIDWQPQQPLIANKFRYGSRPDIYCAIDFAPCNDWLIGIERSFSNGTMLPIEIVYENGEPVAVVTIDGIAYRIKYKTLEELLTWKAPLQQPPIVKAPTEFVGEEGVMLSFNVDAYDPDGQIVELKAFELPEGATFYLIERTCPMMPCVLGEPCPPCPPQPTTGILLWGKPVAGEHKSSFVAYDNSGLKTVVSTLIKVAQPNQPPIVKAPAEVAGQEDSSLSFQVSAYDNDGQVTDLRAFDLPEGATFIISKEVVCPMMPCQIGEVCPPCPPSPVSGSLLWEKPVAGEYKVGFVAYDNGEAKTVVSTLIKVEKPNQPPVVTVPASSVSVQVGQPLLLENGAPVDVRAIDYDGSVASLQAMCVQRNSTTQTEVVVPCPEGIKFDILPSILQIWPLPMIGRVTWTPTAEQVGDVNMLFIATDNQGLPSSPHIEQARMTIHVTPKPNTPPKVEAPAEVAGQEGSSLSFQVSAYDNDGRVTDLQAFDLPEGATFLLMERMCPMMPCIEGQPCPPCPPQPMTGTLIWEKPVAGKHIVQFAAYDDKGLKTVVSTMISINGAPKISAPDVVKNVTGTPLSFSVSAFDADGQVVALKAEGLPEGSQFITTSEVMCPMMVCQVGMPCPPCPQTRGTFYWGKPVAGKYAVQFVAYDNEGLKAPAFTTILIAPAKVVEKAKNLAEHIRAKNYDLNDDGIINTSDFTFARGFDIIIPYAAYLPESDFTTLDLNKNGTLDSMDRTWLLLRVRGAMSR